nr:DUF2891 domain-containing protein [uncultured Sphingomonas sp.]
MNLDQSVADRFARIALGHVTRPYPYKMDHVLQGDDDARPPRQFHPIFFGSFDWHSCCHGWWTLLTLRRLYPDMEPATDIAGLANGSFTAEKVALERAYLGRPTSAGFERPYGWAWLLYLHLEATRHDDRDWAASLEPLARAFADRFKAFLPKLTYPITVGTHFNTAFALTLAREWASAHDPDLLAAIDEWALRTFGDETDYRGWEPGGDEFLSPALTAAMLMSKVMDRTNFAHWFDNFLPDANMKRFEPAHVSDRSDGKIAHLDGLNLSRAWCLRSIAPLVDRPELRDRAQRHLNAALPHVAGDYMGEHWLASFALLALQAATD